MKKFKPSILLIALITVLAGCGDGTIPTGVLQKPSENTDSNSDLEWTLGETVPLRVSSTQAKNLLTNLSQNYELNANQFEDLSINVELRSLSVTNPNNQQYFEGDLSIGWISDGEFQEIRARAETNMMQASSRDCSWWRGCTVMFNEDNEQKRYSFGKGAAVRLIFEILDEWHVDYEKMGGAFIFYGSERGDDGTMEGSIHYLPRYCPNGYGFVDGRKVPCGEKSLQQHCWLLRSGPYQCGTKTLGLAPAAGQNTYAVAHCISNNRWDNRQNKYVCKGTTITRNYTRIGTFRNFDITNANSDYYGSISTSESSRSLASVGDQKPIQKWILYILCLTFFSSLIVAFIGYSKTGSK